MKLAGSTEEAQSLFECFFVIAEEFGLCGRNGDWIDKCSLIVLVLTFIAAGYAAKEAERLANATIDAIARADFASRT